MPATKKRRCAASVARKMLPRWLFARQPHHLSVPSLKAHASAHTVRRTGLRRRLVRRLFARMNGVPQLFTARLLLRLLPPCFSLRLRCRAAYLYPPAARGRRCERREGGRRACRTRNEIAFCGSRLFPLAACLGRVAAIRSGRSRIRRGTAAFWPRAAAISPKCAHFFETAHLQDDRRMGNIVKY